MTDNRTIELLPCPFCGSEPLVIKRVTGTYDVDCANEDCPVTLFTRGYEMRQEAIAAWNTRAERTCERVLPGDDVGRTAVKLVSAHCDGDEGAFRDAAYELARYYDDAGGYQVAEYIFACLNPVCAFVPMEGR